MTITAASSYTSTLLRREEVAQGTMAFHLAKPAGFHYRAGQFIDLTLLNPRETDSEGNTRAFSLASAPYENDLMVATRMRDTAFKRVLGGAAVGFEVKVDGPSGSFTLHRKAEKPAIFLAGGIGITPFVSIIRQAAHDMLPHQLYLFYSNRRPEDAPFMDLLAEAARVNYNFHFVPSMSEMSRSSRPWKGESGLIDREMLKRYVADLQGPIYYIAGPPAMVAAMRRMLEGAEVDEDDIRTEEFSGY